MWSRQCLQCKQSQVPTFGHMPLILAPDILHICHTCLHKFIAVVMLIPSFFVFASDLSGK